MAARQAGIGTDDLEPRNKFPQTLQIARNDVVISRGIATRSKNRKSITPSVLIFRLGTRLNPIRRGPHTEAVPERWR